MGKKATGLSDVPLSLCSRQEKDSRRWPGVPECRLPIPMTLVIPRRPAASLPLRGQVPALPHRHRHSVSSPDFSQGGIGGSYFVKETEIVLRSQNTACFVTTPIPALAEGPSSNAACASENGEPRVYFNPPVFPLEYSAAGWQPAADQLVTSVAANRPYK